VSDSPSPGLVYIPTLHGWRAIAITAVLLCHGFAPSNTDSLPQIQRLIAGIALRLGPQGVSLFFAISGFLITTLLLQELEQTGRISMPGFYVRRALRILPPALVYLAIIGLLGIFGVVALYKGELLSAALWFNNYWPHRSWWTQHYWSLSVEEHFYLFWPTMLVLLGIRGVRWAGAAIIVATAIWRPWSLEHIHLDLPSLQRTDMRLDAFMFACLLAIFVRGARVGPRLVAFLVRPGFRIAAVVAVALVWIITMKVEMPATRLLLQSALVPVIVVSTVFSPGDRFGRLLESAPFHWLGRISYSVYLWQMPFLTPPADLYSAVLWFLPRTALAVFVAYVSYRVVEKPCMIYGRKLAQRMASRHQARIALVTNARTAA
jgi:peptidoglycan/LPS O-acetylase OafA/YrhL